MKHVLLTIWGENSPEARVLLSVDAEQLQGIKSIAKEVKERGWNSVAGVADKMVTTRLTAPLQPYDAELLELSEDLRELVANTDEFSISLTEEQAKEIPDFDSSMGSVYVDSIIIESGSYKIEVYFKHGDGERYTTETVYF